MFEFQLNLSLNFFLNVMNLHIVRLKLFIISLFRIDPGNDQEASGGT